MNLVSSDEVVLQRPEDIYFRLPVFHTDGAGPGAVTSYLLRRIAYRAGAYAPGIQEFLFHELNTGRHGGSLETVQRWFNGRLGDLHSLGYRLYCRRVNERTATILDWVTDGRGYRGAMLPTLYSKVHPGNDSLDHISHAVGITMDRLDATTPEGLVMIDAWPGSAEGASDRTVVPENLDAAHREGNYHALIYYWVGWS
jgi:hypothetical protein